MTSPGGKLHLHIENDNRLDHVFESTPKRVREALARVPALKDKLRVTIGYSGDKLERALKTADALFCWKINFRGIEKRAPNLKWIHIHGAGVEHLLPLDWLPKGMKLTNSSGVHGRCAVEYAATAILMLNNRIPELVTHQRARRWKQCFNSNIEGKTLLIIGVGRIGAGIARWAKSMDLHVLGVRLSGKPRRYVDEMYQPGQIPKLLKRADFVLVAAPLTHDSHHLIGAKELALMKPGAGLVNYSRALVVDYEALRERCAGGEMSAVIDVFDSEPLSRSSPLWLTPNLIITPHCGSDDSSYYAARTLDLVFDNTMRFLAGQRLKNIISRRTEY